MWERFKNWFKNTWLGKFFSRIFGKSTPKKDPQEQVRQQALETQRQQAETLRKLEEDSRRLKQETAQREAAERQRQVSTQLNPTQGSSQAVPPPAPQPAVTQKPMTFQQAQTERQKPKMQTQQDLERQRLEAQRLRQTQEQQLEAQRKEAEYQQQRARTEELLEQARQKQVELQRQEEARAKQREDQRQQEARQKQIDAKRQEKIRLEQEAAQLERAREESERRRREDEVRRQELNLQMTYNQAITLYNTHDTKIGAVLKNSADILGITEEERQSLLTDIKAYQEKLEPMAKIALAHRYDIHFSRIPPLAELQTLIAMMEAEKSTINTLRTRLEPIKTHLHKLKDDMYDLWRPLDRARHELEDSQNRLYVSGYESGWGSGREIDEEDRDEFCQKNYALRDEAYSLYQMRDAVKQFAAKDRLAQCLKDIEIQIVANKERKAIHAALAEQVELKLSLANDLAALVQFAGDEEELEATKKSLEAYREEVREASKHSIAVDSWMTKARATIDTFDQRTAALIQPVMRMVVHMEVVKRVAQALKADKTHPQASLLEELSEEELIHFLNGVAIENEWLFAEGLDPKEVEIGLQPDSPKPPKKDPGSDTPPPAAPAYCYAYVRRAKAVEKKEMKPILKEVFWSKVRRKNSEICYLHDYKEQAVAKEHFEAVLETKPAKLTFKKLIEKIITALKSFRAAEEEKVKAQEQKKEVRYAYARY